MLTGSLRGVQEFSERRPVGSASNNRGSLRWPPASRPLARPWTFCFKARTPVLLSTLVGMEASTFVHRRKSAYGIAVLHAAYAAGSLPWPAPLAKTFSATATACGTRFSQEEHSPASPRKGCALIHYRAYARTPDSAICKGPLLRLRFAAVPCLASTLVHSTARLSLPLLPPCIKKVRASPFLRIPSHSSHRLATRNNVLQMEISYVFVSENSSTPLEGQSRYALQGRRYRRLEIAPASQLTFEERGIGHSAGRQSRPAQ